MMGLGEGVSSVTEALDGGRYGMVLRHLDGEAGWSPEAGLLRTRALEGLERYFEARSEASDVAGSGAPPAIRAEALARSVAARSRIERWNVQQRLDAEQAVRLGEAAGDEGVGALAEALMVRSRLLAGHRARGLAERDLARAHELVGDTPRMIDAEARLAAFFDDRLAARDRYAQAVTDGGGRLAHLGLARMLYLLGDFETAGQTLGARSFADDDLAALRLRLELAEAEHRWDEVVSVLDRILEVSPFGIHALDDRLRRASVLFRLGDVRKAAAAYRDAATGERDARDAGVRRALRLADALEATDVGAGRARLKAFPTVAQLRKHCGPASCELYLRYFGHDADQAAIGERILFEDSGTSVLRMRRYLEEAGFVTRRIEATLPVIHACIDQGVPVIIEERYSQSSHVSVVVGYDDRRALLEVQDPMTHAIRETPYEDLDALQDFSNQGGLVGVPEGDERLARLEAAGVEECRYIALVDEAYLALDEKRLDDIDPLLDQSMALRRDYELAWCCRFECGQARLAADPSPQHRAALHRVVGEALAIWPHDDWARRFAADIAFDEGRYDDALGEYERARNANPGDPWSWVGMGRCLLNLGNRAGAGNAAERALGNDPGHYPALDLITSVAFLDDDREVCRVMNEATLALEPDAGFNHLVRAAWLEKVGAYEAALAAHARVLELEPERAAGTFFDRARDLSKLGRHAEAVALLSDPPEGVDEAPRLDKLFEEAKAAGDPDTALEAAHQLMEIGGWEGVGRALAASIRLEQGAGDEAKKLAIDAMGWDVGCPLGHHELGRYYLSVGDNQAALPAFAFAVALDGDDPRFAFSFGHILCQIEAYEVALPYLVRAAESRTLDEGSLGYCAGMVSYVEGPGAAVGLLRRVGDGADPETRRKALRGEVRVLTQMTWAPEPLAGSLRELHALFPEDPFGLAQAGDDRFEDGLEGEGEGEAMLRKSLELMAGAGEPGHPLPRRLLARRLMDLGRAEEVLELTGNAAEGEAEHVDVALRVEALVFLRRLDEAEALIAAYEQTRYDEDEDEAPPTDAGLRYTLARARGDFEAALVLARQAGEEEGEDLDDARADYWELSQFQCLLAMHRDDEAIELGLGQGGDSESLGQLAHWAVLAGRVRAGGALAEAALRIDADEAYAIHALGRLAELDGDRDRAWALYERAGEADPEWHAWLEELARLSIAAGDPEGAVGYAQRAVDQGGHDCFWAIGVRAQARLAAGDLEGARADALRAYGLGSVESRDRVYQDIWGVIARLAGDEARSQSLFDAFRADPEQCGPHDRARLDALDAAYARARVG